MAGLGWALLAALGGQPPFPEHLVGNVSEVHALLERVVPGSSAKFEVVLGGAACGEGGRGNCFVLSDGGGGRVRVQGSTASELTAGIGVYLREWAGITVGWPRGGGTRLTPLSSWPAVGKTVTRWRSVPYSHISQVCTHSYTLVWHGWAEWERFIDWMALAGHNSIVAPTGQEEVQYKVLTEGFNVSDMQVRNWTNGPAFLTWSRGQNSHGNGIAGPLPRSFMKAQWRLAQQILARYRALGIAGHQPAFGGFAPWALAEAQHDAGPGGATRGRPGHDYDTAWIDGRDPLFTRVADAWMKQIIADFGSDHVWQMDAFFGNGTGWGADEPGLPPCEWSAPAPNAYLKGCAREAGFTAPAHCPSHAVLADAKAACASGEYSDCHGLTGRNCTGAGACVRYELRAGAKLISVPPSDREVAYVMTNAAACLPNKWDLPPDPVYLARAQAAYGAIARADGPTARWVYQAWALHVRGSGMSPPSPTTLSRLHGFSTAAPPGQFILLDMDQQGRGQWKTWQGRWGIPFIWTALPDFGGNMGMKGNISEINAIPFGAPPLSPSPFPQGSPATQAIGVGYTPEGLDQNTAYYELLQEAAFKGAPEPDVTEWLVRRAHRRYGLQSRHNADVAAAWAALGKSGYALDAPVHDGTGVGLMPARGFPDWQGFDTRGAPRPALCLEWEAWTRLLAAASQVADPKPETYTYDLVDAAREVMSQLTIPASLAFHNALKGSRLQPQHLRETAAAYQGVLTDLDKLLATDAAFLLGPWLEMARRLGTGANDCNSTAVGDLDCRDFMEWNARAQLTTWHPVRPWELTLTASNTGPNDYARKQWAGLISSYYVPRVGTYLDQGLLDAEAGRALDAQALDRKLAAMALKWQTDFGNVGALRPVGDAVRVAQEMHTKYAHRFATCHGSA